MNIIDKLKSNKMNLLFVIFWLLIISAAITYTIGDANRVTTNKELIQINKNLLEHNHDDVVKLDSTVKLLIKNDSIIIDKLNKLK